MKMIRNLSFIIPMASGLAFLYGASQFYSAGKEMGTPMYIAAGVFVIAALSFFKWGISEWMKGKDESVSVKEGILLKQTGSKISAEIIHLEQLTGVRVNNRSPYVIHARGLSAGTRVFKSASIWTDPFLQVQNNKHIDVYVDKGNPSRYYMDITSIGLAEQAMDMSLF